MSPIIRVGTAELRTSFPSFFMLYLQGSYIEACQTLPYHPKTTAATASTVLCTSAYSYCTRICIPIYTNDTVQLVIMFAFYAYRQVHSSSTVHTILRPLITPDATVHQVLEPSMYTLTERRVKTAGCE